MTTATGPHRRQQRSERQQSGAPGMIERVVQINHVAKVVAGGRRFGFSTIVVVGDGQGAVGVSIGKAKEVPESITKGRGSAMKHMAKIKMVNGTIPHEVVGRCGATRVLLRPAVPGTGIIAGKSVRAILESAGIRDILSKTIGSSNAVNVVKATMDGLVRLQLPEDVAEMRGKTVGEIFIAKRSRRMIKSEEESAQDRGESGGFEQQQSPSSAGRRREGRPASQSQDASSRQRPPHSFPRNTSESRPSSSSRRPDRKPRPDRDRRPDRPSSPPSSPQS